MALNWNDISDYSSGDLYPYDDANKFMENLYYCSKAHPIVGWENRNVWMKVPTLFSTYRTDLIQKTICEYFEILKGHYFIGDEVYFLPEDVKCHIKSTDGSGDRYNSRFEGYVGSTTYIYNLFPIYIYAYYNTTAGEIRFFATDVVPTGVFNTSITGYETNLYIGSILVDHWSFAVFEQYRNEFFTFNKSFYTATVTSTSWTKVDTHLPATASSIWVIPEINNPSADSWIFISGDGSTNNFRLKIESGNFRNNLAFVPVLETGPLAVSGFENAQIYLRVELSGGNIKCYPVGWVDKFLRA